MTTKEAEQKAAAEFRPHIKSEREEYLIKLGLWAEQHGVLKLLAISEAKGFTRFADCCVDKTCHINSETNSCSFQTGVHYGNCDRAADADEALAALPKGDE